MRVPGRLTTLQSILLARLRDEFEVDISESENLSGPLLDEWLKRAEDALFSALMGSLNQERAREGA